MELKIEHLFAPLPPRRPASQYEWDLYLAALKRYREYEYVTRPELVDKYAKQLQDKEIELSGDKGYFYLVQPYELRFFQTKFYSKDRYIIFELDKLYDNNNYSYSTRELNEYTGLFENVTYSIVDGESAINKAIKDSKYQNIQNLMNEDGSSKYDTPFPIRLIKMRKKDNENEYFTIMARLSGSEGADSMEIFLPLMKSKIGPEYTVLNNFFLTVQINDRTPLAIEGKNYGYDMSFCKRKISLNHPQLPNEMDKLPTSYIPPQLFKETMDYIDANKNKKYFINTRARKVFYDPNVLMEASIMDPEHTKEIESGKYEDRFYTYQDEGTTHIISEPDMPENNPYISEEWGETIPIKVKVKRITQEGCVSYWKKTIGLLASKNYKLEHPTQYLYPKKINNSGEFVPNYDGVPPECPQLKIDIPPQYSNLFEYIEACGVAEIRQGGVLPNGDLEYNIIYNAVATDIGNLGDIIKIIHEIKNKDADGQENPHGPRILTMDKRHDFYSK